MATWEGPYQLLKTASAPVNIKLTADRNQIKANNQDLSYVTVELTDSNGTLNPRAENLVHFAIDGPGVIAGVGNGNPVSVESSQQPKRNAWRGKCLVIIKSTDKSGNINLKVTVDGFPRKTVLISSK